MDNGTDEQSEFINRVTLPEMAERVVADVRSRQLPPCHVITFANEKGGVGKSTLAFHCAVALANAGAEVLALDLDYRQRTLATALENRRGTATCLSVDIACPNYAVVEKQTGSALVQEINRLGSKARFVIIDAPGSDTPLGRRAIALANTLVTPLNASFLDLQQLGRFNPVSMQLSAPGPFAGLVGAIQAERVKVGQAPADWVLLKNRVRSSEQRQQKRIDEALDRLADVWQARTASGLSERVAYRELFLFGLLHGDLKKIPQLRASARKEPQDIGRLLAELRLPPMGIGSCSRRTSQARVLERTRENYLKSLQTHLASDRVAGRRN